MFFNQHITSCSLLVVEVHLFLPIFTNYSVTTKGPWLDQYSCPFSWLVELVNKANCYILWTGQMNQILYLSCDWLPVRARWSPILPSRDCSQYPAKNFLESFIDQARWGWGGWILDTRKRTSPSPAVWPHAWPGRRGVAREPLRDFRPSRDLRVKHDHIFICVL